MDELDKQILQALAEDARVSFTDLAEKLHVSHGTIHVRVNKLKESGALLGTTARVDPKKIGFQVSCFMGINLKHSGDYPKVMQRLKKLRPVNDIFFTTGPYSLLIKIAVQDVEELKDFMINELQGMNEIQSTETLVILDHPHSKPLYP